MAHLQIALGCSLFLLTSTAWGADDPGGWGEFRWGSSPYSAANAAGGTLVDADSELARFRQDAGDLPVEVQRTIMLFDLPWKQEAKFGCGSLGLRLVTASAPSISVTHNLFLEVAGALESKYGKGRFYDVGPDSVSEGNYWSTTVGNTTIHVHHYPRRPGVYYGRLTISYWCNQWVSPQDRRAACRSPKSLDKL